VVVCEVEKFRKWFPKTRSSQKPYGTGEHIFGFFEAPSEYPGNLFDSMTAVLSQAKPQ
jgi:hypothetical protein